MKDPEDFLERDIFAPSPGDALSVLNGDTIVLLRSVPRDDGVPGWDVLITLANGTLLLSWEYDATIRHFFLQNHKTRRIIRGGVLS